MSPFKVLWKEQKWTLILLMVSVIVLAIGVVMVVSKANEPIQQPVDEVSKTFDVMTQIAASAEAELIESTDVNAGLRVQVPQAVKDRVSAMNGQEPEQGTEAWCDWMMLKESADWKETEQVVFAQSCL